MLFFIPEGKIQFVCVARICRRKK